MDDAEAGKWTLAALVVFLVLVFLFVDRGDGGSPGERCFLGYDTVECYDQSPEELDAMRREDLY